MNKPGNKTQDRSKQMTQNACDMVLICLLIACCTSYTLTFKCLGQIVFKYLYLQQECVKFIKSDSKDFSIVTKIYKVQIFMF